MRPVRLGRDFFAGLLYVAFGAAAVAIGGRYPIGSTARMGPGYFPVLIGVLLIVIGLVVGVRGIRVDAERVGPFAFKPLLLVLGAVALFALTIESMGLPIALLRVIVVGYLANPRWQWGELVLLAVLLTAVSVGVFYYGLKLPFTLWPGAH